MTGLSKNSSSTNGGSGPIYLPPSMENIVVRDLATTLEVGDIRLNKFLSSDSPHPSLPDNFVLTSFDAQRLLVLAEAIQKNRPTLIQGGAGTGKNSSVLAIAAALNYPCYIVNCATVSIEDVIGKAWPTQDRVNHPSGFRFYPGPAYEALKYGGILCFDEWNYSKDDFRGRLHPFFDAILNPESTVSFPENEGETVRPHRNFRILGLQNPPGEGFRGRKVLDEPQYGRWKFINEPLDIPHEDKLMHWIGCMKKIYGSKSVEDNQELKNTGAQVVDLCLTLTKMIEEGKLAVGEAQRPYITFRRELVGINSWLIENSDKEFQSTIRDAVWREIMRKFRDSDRTVVLAEINKIKYNGPPIHNLHSLQLEQFSKSLREKAVSIKFGNSKQEEALLAENTSKEEQSKAQNSPLSLNVSIGADVSTAAVSQHKKSFDPGGDLRDALTDLGA